jgi:alpha-L-rhamnosidase
MKAWVEYIRARADKGLLWNTGFHFGDWVALDAKEGSYFGATPNDLTATAYYFYSVTLSARAAEVLRKADDADTYRTLAQDITQAFRKEFFTPSGRLVARTQTAHILALVLGLVPPEHRLRCVADLGALIAENGGHLTTGFLGTPWILRALSENGRLDEAYNLLLKEDFPSWLFQVNMGATTVWEHWDGMKADGTLWSADMNSFNHYAYGAVGQWMYQTIGGLAPDSTSEDGVGWKAALYKPQPGGGLTEGRIGYVSLYGLHSVEWVIRDGRMETVVTVPPNTRATLILPSRGADIQGPEGITFTDGQDGGRCSLGSGTYRFSCPA